MGNLHIHGHRTAFRLDKGKLALLIQHYAFCVHKQANYFVGVNGMIGSKAGYPSQQTRG
jgi:hypothetical protein